MQIEAGTCLGHYRIVAPIGRGGMGEVWRATDDRLGRDVAIKFLPDDLAADTRALERFEREARAASALNHPNIATLHDVGLHDGRRFLVMELLEGRTLHERIGGAPMPVEEIFDAAYEISRALIAAHDKGIVHRDIKPSNLFVTDHGHVKVLDFGLAKQSAEIVPPPAGEHATVTTPEPALTATGETLGTVSYMSPEQARGEEVDARTDIYSLGCVLYEMATGCRPFQAGPAAVVFDAILNRPPAAPRSINPLIPPELESIILRTLEKDRDRRYPTASALLDDLKRVRRSLNSIPAASGPGRSRSRGPVIAVLAILAIAVLVAIAGYYRPGGDGGRGTATVQAPLTGLDESTPLSPVAEANEYYEKALLFLRPQFEMSRARQMLERALELDPDFATARVIYGMTFILSVQQGFSNDIEQVYRGEREIRRALEQAPDLATGHTCLGAAYLFHNRADLAQQEFETALRLDPETFPAMAWLAIQASLAGEPARAEVFAKKCLERAPLFFAARYLLADILFEQGKTEEAAQEIAKIYEQDAGNVSAHCSDVRLRLAAGDVAGARARLDEILDPEHPNFRVQLVEALTLARENRREDALELLDEPLFRFAEIAPFAASQVAEVYSSLGLPDEALDWLDRAVRGGDERLAWFRNDPFLAAVREEPRFSEIVDAAELRSRE